MVNFPGVGLTGSFKLVIKKPIKVKKIKEPSTLVSGKISIITAEVYGSTTKVAKSKEIPKPKADKKVNSKTKSSNKENTEEKVEPAKKKGKTGPKIEVVAKKPKEATVKIKAVTKQPKEATKREVPKKDLEQDTEEVPKKMRKPGPKKVVAPKEKQEVVTKKTAVAKKIPAKTTVGAIRKSIDNEKKKVAVPRPKRKG